MKRRSAFFYNFIIFAIILLSFWIYSPVCYRYMNSDQAIHILMAEHFSFSNSLYYWGQNRLGSIIPMVAHLFVVLGMKAIWAVSITVFILLSITYFLFSSLFKSRFIKIAFAILFFIPFSPFNTILFIGQPYIGNLFFIAFPTYLINDILKNKNSYIRNNYFNFLVALASFSTVLSVWANEMSFTFIATIAVFLAVYFYHRYNSKAIDNQYIKQVIYGFVGALPALAFLIFAKMSSPRNDAKLFVDIKKFFLILSTIVENIWIKLSFNGNDDIWVSIASWFFVISAILLLKIQNLKSLFATNTIRKFAFLNFWFALILCCLSNWVFINAIDKRYFSMVYFWGIVLLLIRFESIEWNRKYKKIAIGVFVFIVSLATILSNLNYYKNQYSDSEYQHLKGFSSLGQASIIGGYWDSYIVGIANPKDLIVTSFDNDFDSFFIFRNPHQIKKLFSRNNIYVITKDTSKTFFKDKMSQFGYSLQKTGSPFDLCGYKLAKYKNLGEYTGETFLNNRFSTQTDARKIYDATNPSDSVFSTIGRNKNQGYFTFGPYITLYKSKYTVDWFIKQDSLVNENLLKVDIAVNGGNTILGKKEVNGKMLKTKKFKKISIDFEVIDEKVNSVEFRIFDYAKTSLTLGKVVLIKHK